MILGDNMLNTKDIIFLKKFYTNTLTLKILMKLPNLSLMIFLLENLHIELICC